MSVILKDNVGYGQAGMYLLQEEKVSPIYVERPNQTVDARIASPREVITSNPWSPWGQQNDMPVSIGRHMDNCSVLNSGIDTKARIAIGKGLRPFKLVNVDPLTGEETLEFCNDPEILDFLEENQEYNYAYALTRDGLAYGWDHTTLLFNRGRTRINRFERTDIATCRLEKANPKTGIIEHTYQCQDWQSGHSYNTDTHVKLPLLRPGREKDDLLQRTDGYEFAFINRSVSNLRYYYPLPIWWAAKIWVEIAQEIPLYKKSAYKNQMSVKYLICISSKYWDNNIPNYGRMSAEEKKGARDVKLDEIDKYLVGSPNAHKSIFCTTEIDAATGKEIKDIQIEVLDDKMKDGKMLPDSAAADKQVMFAIQMNPALNGSNLLSDGASGGGGSGSDIREAFLVQLMLNEFERRKAARLFQLIKHVNGWQARYPSNQLVFRYPSSVLTTLDTGKSTKPENA